MTETGYVKIKNIKPVLSGYLRKTQLLLKRNDVPDEKTIHDIRVFLKKSRAALKLIRSQDETEANDRDILSLKMAGRLLSDIRDTSVQRKVMKDLRKEYPDLFIRLSGNDTVNSLMVNVEKNYNEIPGLKEKLAEAGDLLYKTGYSIRFRSMNDFDPQLLMKELGYTYNKVSDCYVVARNQPSVTNIHKFRKRSKDFLYQLYFFRLLNPSSVKSLEKKLDSLTRNLGRHNDLSQLIGTLDYNPVGNNEAALDELVIHIRERQDLYMRKFWSVAFRLFCPGTNFINLLGFKILVF